MAAGNAVCALEAVEDAVARRDGDQLLGGLRQLGVQVGVGSVIKHEINQTLHCTSPYYD